MTSREITIKKSLMKNQMEKKLLNIMDVSNLTTSRDKSIMLKEVTTPFQPRAWILCVSISQLIFINQFLLIVGYEFTHKPDLFNSTTLGRAAAAQMASGTMRSTTGPLASMKVTDACATVAKNINPTQHW